MSHESRTESVCRLAAVLGLVGTVWYGLALGLDAAYPWLWAVLGTLGSCLGLLLLTVAMVRIAGDDAP